MKQKLLALTAIAAFCNAGYAVAFDPRTQGNAIPDVEVNNSVLDSLGSSPQPVGGSSKDFLNEQPVKYAKPAVKHMHKKKKHKPRPKVECAPAAKVDTAPEVKVVGDSGANPSNPDSIPQIVSLPNHNQAAASTVAVPAPTVSPAPEIPSVPAPVSSDAKPSAAHHTATTPPAAAPLPLSAAQSDLPPLPQSAPAIPAAPVTPSAPPANAVPMPVPAASDLPPLPTAGGAPAPQMATQDVVPPAAAPSSSADNGSAPDLSIVFNEAETELPFSETSKLDALVQQINQNPSSRISVVAYASGPEAAAGVALSKRVSLKRGIAVRNYIVNKNVDEDRITVKAQGNKTSGQANRVDIFIIK